MPEVTDVYKTIGRSLRRILEQKGISQSEVARWFEVSPQFVNGWLRGDKIPLHTLIVLAQKLEVSLDELAGMHAARSELSDRDKAVLDLVDTLTRLGVEEVAKRVREGGKTNNERPPGPKIIPLPEKPLPVPEELKPRKLKPGEKVSKKPKGEDR